MKAIILSLTLFCIFFSCKKDTSVSTPAPKAPEAPIIKKKVLKAENLNATKYVRLLLDNPEGKPVTIVEKENDEKESSKTYDSILLENLETIKFKIGGKSYSEKIGDSPCALINPSKRDYLKQELVYVDGVLSDAGPFTIPTVFFKSKTEGEAGFKGRYTLIEKQVFINEFTLGPEDQVPNTINAKGEKLKRFYKLIRY